jgi:hypothetical protein
MNHTKSSEARGFKVRFDVFMAVTINASPGEAVAIVGNYEECSILGCDIVWLL